MRAKCLPLLGSLVVGLSILTWVLSVTAQEVPDSWALTPTPVMFPPPHFARPELICPYFPDIQPGYSWHNLIIGVSTQKDLESILEQFGTYEIVLPYEGVQPQDYVPVGVSRRAKDRRSKHLSRLMSASRMQR